jgi:hypothetical protein
MPPRRFWRSRNPSRRKYSRGLLTAYTVVALEDDARITIQAEQRVVIRLIQQARADDPRERALLIRADVDQLERRAALGHCLELRSGQLANRRRLVRCSVIGQGVVILVR